MKAHLDHLGSVLHSLAYRNRAPRRARKPQNGMTLVEMIIGISMLAVITGPLTTSAILFADHGNDVDKSLTDDGSVRSISSMWITDAQSASSVTLSDPSPCDAKGTAIATLGWAERGVSYTSSWYVEAVADSLTLVRRRCADGTLVGYQRVAEVASPPSVTCSPSCVSFRSLTIKGTLLNGAAFALTGSRRTT